MIFFAIKTNPCFSILNVNILFIIMTFTNVEFLFRFDICNETKIVVAIPFGKRIIVSFTKRNQKYILLSFRSPNGIKSTFHFRFIQQIKIKLIFDSDFGIMKQSKSVFVLTSWRFLMKTKFMPNENYIHFKNIIQNL